MLFTSGFRWEIEDTRKFVILCLMNNCLLFQNEWPAHQHHTAQHWPSVSPAHQHHTTLHGPAVSPAHQHHYSAWTRSVTCKSTPHYSAWTRSVTCSPTPHCSAWTRSVTCTPTPHYSACTRSITCAPTQHYSARTRSALYMVIHCRNQVVLYLLYLNIWKLYLHQQIWNPQFYKLPVWTIQPIST